MTRILRRLCLAAMFHCARFVITVTRMPVRGALVAAWHQGQILLVRKTYRSGWALPGGLVKRHETFEEAAVRETAEEVGIQLMASDLQFVADVPGDLGPRDRAHLFETAITKPVSVVIDDVEIRTAEFVSPEAALRRPLNRHLRHYLVSTQKSARGIGGIQASEQKTRHCSP